jgi:hypothetical protein
MGALTTPAAKKSPFAAKTKDWLADLSAYQRSKQLQSRSDVSSASMSEQLPKRPL